MSGRWLAVAAGVCMLSGAFPRAQAPAPLTARTFEVATIKLNTEGGGSSQRTSPNGTLTFINNTPRNIIRNAYGLQGAQVIGGPDWLDTDRYDVVAKADAPFTADEGRLMLRALLADRFALTAHAETREAPVFLLRHVRADRTLGPRMRTSTVDCMTLAAAKAKLPCGFDVRLAAGSVTGAGVSVAQLARNLMGAAGRMIVDETGLTGTYDLELTFALEPAPDSPAPSLFTALQEQLGLKLEPGRGPIDVLVIDRAQRPTVD
jgi:uncharacterized protein (TIGR03435 family)